MKKNKTHQEKYHSTMFQELKELPKLLELNNHIPAYIKEEVDWYNTIYLNENYIYITMKNVVMKIDIEENLTQNVRAWHSTLSIHKDTWKLLSEEKLVKIKTNWYREEEYNIEIKNPKLNIEIKDNSRIVDNKLWISCYSIMSNHNMIKWIENMKPLYIIKKEIEDYQLDTIKELKNISDMVLNELYVNDKETEAYVKGTYKKYKIELFININY